MKRLWHAPGVIAGAAILALAMVYTARQVGVHSPHFWWSLVICVVVLAAALTFRYLTNRQSGSNGPHRSNRQPSGLN